MSTQLVSARLDPEQVRRLDARAEQRGMDRTGYIRFAIDQTLHAEDLKEAGWRVAPPEA